MEEKILSAGIDIGTSTTQLVFSRLWIQNVSGFGMIPQIKIVKKEILYRSDIYYTPLISTEEIDAEAVKKIIWTEYKKAGVLPEDLTTGAVIITGETSKKRNAREVVDALSKIAGNFVVATAGPDLESVLAGRGAGAAALSMQTGKLVANLDIGGGTSNICYFRDGKVVETGCLDIGGRLIKIENGKVSYISEKMKQFMGKKNIVFKVGEAVDLEKKECYEKFQVLTKCMTELLEQSVGLAEPSQELEFMKTNRLIKTKQVPDMITFSGGVADCIYKKYENKLAFGDIGVLLGEAIEKSERFQLYLMENQVEETMRATVVGAGNYSMEVSGSTIEYKNCSFPIKNIPVVHVDITEENLENLHLEIKNKVSRFREGERNQIALAAKGLPCPSFLQIEKIAEEIIKAMKAEIEEEHILILILETDIGKALGQAIRRRMPKEKPVLCIDKIICSQGDYIDIGEPIASGNVLPVVVKTLIFYAE